VQHDPAYECLVTDLVRIALTRLKTWWLTVTFDWLSGFVKKVTGISCPRLKSTYHESRGSVCKFVVVMFVGNNEQ